MATTGTLGVAGEHDWLEATLVAGQAYEFTITGLTDYANIEIATAAVLNEGVSAVQTVETLGTQSAATDTVWFTPATSGSYYVDISDPGTVGGTYSVSAVTEPNDFPDNTSTTGVVTVGGAATTGTLGVSGEHDWLAVTLSAVSGLRVHHHRSDRLCQYRDRHRRRAE